MDETLRGLLLWGWISLSALLGLGVLWVFSSATFWMLPRIIDPPDWPTFLGLFFRIGIISLVSAAWSGVSVIGWRRFIRGTERWVDS